MYHMMVKGLFTLEATRDNILICFFLKLATENRPFYKEQISILSRVASSVNKP